LAWVTAKQNQNAIRERAPNQRFRCTLHTAHRTFQNMRRRCWGSRGYALKRSGQGKQAKRCMAPYSSVAKSPPCLLYLVAGRTVPTKRWSFEPDCKRHPIPAPISKDDPPRMPPQAESGTPSGRVCRCIAVAGGLGRLGSLSGWLGGVAAAAKPKLSSGSRGAAGLPHCGPVPRAHVHVWHRRGSTPTRLIATHTAARSGARSNTTASADDYECGESETLALGERATDQDWTACPKHGALGSPTRSARGGLMTPGRLHSGSSKFLETYGSTGRTSMIFFRFLPLPTDDDVRWKRLATWCTFHRSSRSSAGNRSLASTDETNLARGCYRVRQRGRHSEFSGVVCVRTRAGGGGGGGAEQAGG